MRTGARLWSLAILAFFASCNAGPDRYGQTQDSLTLPSGFSQTVVASGVQEPTALAFLPDGRILITGRAGKVRVVKDGSLLGTPAIDLSANVCPQRERGLLGIAVDPEFASNKYVYLYYTRKKSNCDLHDQTGNGAINRVSRFTYNTSTDRLTNETVIVDHILSYNGWHNAGDLHFGQDGYLYFSVGDSGAKLGSTTTGWGNNNSRWKSLMQGKVHRVRKEDGAPAPGNPWLNAAGSRRCGDPNQSPQYPLDNNKPCQETFVWGFRNPFRFAFKPGTNQFFINDVGQNIGNDWEEIDEAVAGSDYGWNKNQGVVGEAGTRDPIYAYAIGETVGGADCRSITGGTFVPDGAWPAAYEGGYLFSDYVCGVMFYIKRENNKWVRKTFATGFGGSNLVHLVFGPGPGGRQSLYYTAFSDDQVVRIDPPAPADTNTPPTARVAANPTYGSTPLVVHFDGSASTPNDTGDSIGKYMWSFGDGTATQTTTSPTVDHTYGSRARRTVTLTVEDTKAPRKTHSTTIEVQPGNTPPVVTITDSPDLFVVGEPMTLHATVTDAEDASIPAASIAWNIKKIHDDHWHPFLDATGASVTFTPEGPEGLAAAISSHYLVTVTARDSWDLPGTTQLEVHPHTVPIKFETTPPGLRLRVDDSNVNGGQTVTSWEGWDMRVAAPAQTVSGQRWVFDTWSDGGGGEHTIRTPGAAATYRATFKHGPSGYHINFQLGTATTPDGYLEDDGSAFGARGDGLSYGWDQDNTAAARERNNAASPDKRYDTTILMQKTANRKWEIALPNGTYEVHLVAGDANYFDSVYDITAEGRAFLSGTPTTGNRWIEKTGNVTVSDGRLTIDNGPGGQNNRICFIDIAEVSAPPPFSAKINFQLGTAPVPDGYLMEDGAAFRDRGNGLSYGFDQDNTVAARDRNEPGAPDQRYDTTILFQKAGNRFWELAVPNGSYDVHVVAGDSAYWDSVYDFTAEGTTILSGTPTTANRWIETTATVTVSDGRLTLNNGPNGRNNRICFVEVVGR